MKPFRKRPLLSLTAARIALGGVAAIAFIYGLGQVGHGLYIKAKAHVAQVLLDRAFERSRSLKTTVKPWPWADTWPVARLSVPRLGESSIVMAGATGEAMAFGPGHMHVSARLGASGTAIVAAHRDTHFAYLGNVELGDLIDVATADGVRASYRVTDLRVVRWDQSGLEVATAGSRLALVTCWPFNALVRGPLRYVVEAERIETPALLAVSAQAK